MRSSVLLLGVPVDDVTMDEAVDDIARFVGDGRATGRSHQVTTVNLDFVTNALRDREVMGLLQRAALSIPDGMPIIWGARLLRSPLRSRVAGADLVDALSAKAATAGWTIYLFGGAPGTAEEAAGLLSARHRGARVIGDSGPSLSSVEEMDRRALDRIRDARADVLCVALGNPKQERWIARYARELEVPVSIGVGGTFDFIVGRRRRAPSWVQRAGLEWVYRAIQEPGRLGPRYAVDGLVCGPRLVAQLWRRWRHRRERPATAWSPASVATSVDGELRIEAAGNLDPRRDAGLARLELGRVRRAEVDVSAVDEPDDRTVETLVSLGRAVPGGVRIVGAAPSLRKMLVDEHVVDIFEQVAERAGTVPSDR